MEKHQVAEHQAVIHPDNTPQYSRDSLRTLNPFDTFEVNGDVLPAADVLEDTGTLRPDYAEVYENQPYEPSHPEEPIDFEQVRIQKEQEAWDKVCDRYGEVFHSYQEARLRTEQELGPRPELLVIVERSPYALQAIDAVNARRIELATTESEKSRMRAQAVGRASLYGRRS